MRVTLDKNGNPEQVIEVSGTDTLGNEIVTVHSFATDAEAAKQAKQFASVPEFVDLSDRRAALDGEAAKE